MRVLLQKNLRRFSARSTKKRPATCTTPMPDICPPILIRKGRAELLEVNGMVLGAFPDQPYGRGRVELQPGDLLAAYTDGITEPENEYGEEFGERRLTELLIRNARRPLEELVTVVTEAASAWGSAAEQQDDMTLLLLRRL